MIRMKTSSPYSYKVMVSVNGDQWATVVDNSKIWYFGRQTHFALFFTKNGLHFTFKEKILCRFQRTAIEG